MVVAPVRLGLLHAGSFGVVHVLWEISSVYALKFREISLTLVWCCIRRDGGNKIMALLVLRTRELLKFI